MARSFLRPPFMWAYGGSSSEDGRIVTPEPALSPEAAGRTGPESPLAACWPKGCLSVMELDVQGEDGELGACDGAGGGSEPDVCEVCWGVCCAEEAGSSAKSAVWSSMSTWSCDVSAGLLSAL